MKEKELLKTIEKGLNNNIIEEYNPIQEKVQQQKEKKIMEPPALGKKQTTTTTRMYIKQQHQQQQQQKQQTQQEQKNKKNKNKQIQQQQQLRYVESPQGILSSQGFFTRNNPLSYYNCGTTLNNQLTPPPPQQQQSHQQQHIQHVQHIQQQQMQQLIAAQQRPIQQMYYTQQLQQQQQQQQNQNYQQQQNQNYQQLNNILNNNYNNEQKIQKLQQVQKVIEQQFEKLSKNQNHHHQYQQQQQQQQIKHQYKQKEEEEETKTFEEDATAQIPFNPNKQREYPEGFRFVIKPARKSVEHFLRELPGEAYSHPYKYDIRIYIPPQYQNTHHVEFKLYVEREDMYIEKNARNKNAMKIENVTTKYKNTPKGFTAHRIVFQVCSFHYQKSHFQLHIYLVPNNHKKTHENSILIWKTSSFELFARKTKKDQWPSNLSDKKEKQYEQIHKNALKLKKKKKATTSKKKKKVVSGDRTDDEDENFQFDDDEFNGQPTKRKRTRLNQHVHEAKAIYSSPPPPVEEKRPRRVKANYVI